MKDSIDSFGLITKQGDQGDTASREFCVRYIASFCRVRLPLYHISNLNTLMACFSGAMPVRGPKEGWVSQPDRFSRDQLIPLLIFLCYNPAYKPYLNKLAKAHAKRGFLFAWNSRKNGTIAAPWKLPDITGPNIWATWLRAYWPPMLWPVIWPILCILDFYMLLNVVFALVQAQIGKIEHDTQNMTLMAHFSANRLPTPLSWLTWLIWANTRLYGQSAPLSKQTTYTFFDEDVNEPPVGHWLRLLL